ncbi:ABC transporter substrate-binding protein [Nonomuraea sp. NPDC050783]|uniref:ABC transporter substrate-binding protein n=1 Tax=Nonomuraea sp. NPDC050783 TaxID=3154634 RepID=UPI00346796CE
MADLRDVIERLVRRPAFWRADPPLPMVLVTGEHALAAVKALAEPFADSLPYAFVQDGEHESIQDLVESLAGEHGQLGKPVGGSLLPPPRFPVAQFVLWAREQRNLPPESGGVWPPEPRSHTGYREFKIRLRSWHRRTSGSGRGVWTTADFLTRAATTWVPVGTLAVWWVGGASDLVGVLPWLLGALVALAGTGAQGVLSIRGSLFMRWLRTTSALRRKRFERLAQYALRLADAPVAVFERVLVQALMQDLRDAYKKWLIPWPSWGRGRYALLALEVNNPSGTNARFLQLVEEVTQQAHLLAPVVVLASVLEIPPRPQAVPERLGRLDEAVDGWRSTVRRAVPDLRLVVEASDPPSYGPQYRPPPPRGMRAWAYWAVIMLLVAAPIAAVFGVQWDMELHCGGLPWVERVEGECVGIVNATDAELDPSFTGGVRTLMEDIGRNNDSATSFGRYVSVVLIGEFSFKDRGADDPHVSIALAELMAIKEVQAGVAATPRLRVLLANAGDNFEHAQKAARLVTELAEQDPHVLAVVGMHASVVGVSQAIDVLHRAKIPMVTSTATADTLGHINNPGKPGESVSPSPYYFTVAPKNRREAALGARYARLKLLHDAAHPSSVIIEDGSASDNYTRNLANDFDRALQQQNIEVKARIRYSNQAGGLSTAARQACDLHPGVIIYAGRALEFRPFLLALESHACGKVKVIASDDVVNMVSGHHNDINDLRQVEVYYVSLASRHWWSPASATGFISKLQRSAAYDGLPDDKLILTYDAANVVYQAASAAYWIDGVDGEQEVLPNRGDVLYQLARPSRAPKLTGSGGVLRFSAAEPHIPLDKAIAMMRVRDRAAPEVLCGRLDQDRAADEPLCSSLPDADEPDGAARQNAHVRHPSSGTGSP